MVPNGSKWFSNGSCGLRSRGGRFSDGFTCSLKDLPGHSELPWCSGPSPTHSGQPQLSSRFLQVPQSFRFNLRPDQGFCNLEVTRHDGPKSFKEQERLAIHTDLAQLSRLWWFRGLVVKGNLIFGPSPPDPLGDPRTPGSSETIIANLRTRKP